MASTPTLDVVVREVGPRDGLQSLDHALPVGDRVRLVSALVAAGIKRIEAGSFVSQRAVPQMADTADVFEAAQDTVRASREALVVNRMGAERALEAGADALVVVVAASETFSMANVRMSTQQALETIGEIVSIAADGSKPVVADIATAFGCAYEGPIGPLRVASVAEALQDFGITEITLADTTGMAMPPDVAGLVDLVRDRCDVTVGLHFHNTRGVGLANAWAGLQAGVRLFDSSVGGIGGCPFSPGATGNIATEDLVHLLEATGYTTGIDLSALIAVGLELEADLGFRLPGQLLRSGPRWGTKVRSS